MAVTAYIEGIGNIVVDGAASEDTLQRVAAAVERSAGIQGSAANNFAAAANRAADGSRNLSISFDRLENEVIATSSSMMSLSQASQLAGRRLSAASRSFSSGDIKSGISDIMSAAHDFSNSIGGTAGKVVKGLLTFGSVASAISLGALSRTEEAFFHLNSAGASFGGSMSEIRNIIKDSRIPLEDFVDAVKNNAKSLSILGGTITGGSKIMASLGRTLQDSGLERQLYTLGIQYKDQLGFVADYGSQLRLLGMSTEQFRSQQGVITRDSVAYAKSLKVISEITGENAEAQKAALEQQRSNVALQSSLNLKIASGEITEAQAQGINKIAATLEQTVGPAAAQAYRESITGVVTTSGAMAAQMFKPAIDAAKATTDQIQSGAISGADAGSQLVKELGARQGEIRNMVTEMSRIGVLYDVAGDNSYVAMTRDLPNIMKLSTVDFTNALKDTSNAAKGPADQLTRSAESLASAGRDFKVFADSLGTFVIQTNLFNQSVTALTTGLREAARYAAGLLPGGGTEVLSMTKIGLQGVPTDKMTPEERERYERRVQELESEIESQNEEEKSNLGRLREKVFGRQFGGAVTANQPYIVGEEGPEIFKPSVNGSVINNGVLQSLVESEKTIAQQMINNNVTNTNMTETINVGVSRQIELLEELISISKNGFRNEEDLLTRISRN